MTKKGRSFIAILIPALALALIGCPQSDAAGQISTTSSTGSGEYQAEMKKIKDEQIALERNKQKFEVEKLEARHKLELERLAETHEREKAALKDDLTSTHKLEVEKLDKAHRLALDDLKEKFQDEREVLAQRVSNYQTLAAAVGVAALVFLTGWIVTAAILRRRGKNTAEKSYRPWRAPKSVTAD